MSVYRAAALDQIEAAQRDLIRHLSAAAHGRCRACAAGRHCPILTALYAALARYGCLPRRRPGATLTTSAEPPEPFAR